MPLDGFSGHGHCIIEIIPRREAARYIRHFYPPSMLLITRANCDWIKHSFSTPKDVGLRPPSQTNQHYNHQSGEPCFSFYFSENTLNATALSLKQTSC